MTKKNSAAIKNKKYIKTAVSVIFWLGIWTLLSALVDKELIIPSPFAVVRRLGGLVLTADFWIKTGTTMLRIVAGFVMGTLLGILFAALSYASQWAEAVFAPFIGAVRAAPVVSFIILVMLWVSYSLVPAFISALIVLPVVYQNTLSGIRQTDSSLLELTECYKFSAAKKLRVLYIPSVRPYFLSAAVTAMGLAWKSGIAAEVLCLPKRAMGSQIYFSKLYLETPDLFAWTAAVVAISFVFEKLLKKLVAKKQNENIGGKA